MADFNWQTEEDTSWGEIQSGAAEKEQKNGRGWLPILFAFAGIALVSGLLIWRAQSQVGGAEAARKDDIIAASNLLVLATDQQDLSILLSILPVENTPWTSHQKALLDRDLLLGRWPLGFHHSEQEPVVKEVTLSPDLETADVTLEIPYRAYKGERLETVRLQRNFRFEFRSEWRWIEQNSDYWGGLGNEVYESASFSVLFPPRDEALVQRLVDDLNSVLRDMCDGPGQPPCGDNLSLLLHFEKEPTMLLDMAQRIEENGAYAGRISPSSIRNGVVFLPTPSLVGIPVDEAGYQALLRGYATHIFSAVMAKLYEEECCPDELSYSLFLESQMSLGGLGFWPPPTLYRAIEAEGNGRLLPENDIALLCTTDDERQLALYRFSPGSGQLRSELNGRNIVQIRAAPNGKGILAQEAEVISEDEVLTRIIYWHDRTARILFEETLPETVFAALRWQVHEAEERLFIILPDLDSRVTTFILIGLADCAAGSCPKSVNDLIGGPTWSPDGSQFLVKSGNILWWRQFVGEKIEQTPLGLGTAPFWIDNQTFGFVRTLENRIQEIVYGTSEDDEPAVALSSERLRELITADNRPEKLMLGYVGVNGGADTDRQAFWTILGFEWQQNGGLGEAFIFSYNRDEDILSVKLRSEQLHSFNLSPDGRWLAASLYDTTLERWRMKIEPIQDGDENNLLIWQAKEEAEQPSYDWTHDSQWLLILHRGVLSLYTPGEEAAQIAPPPIPGCVQAEWMN